MKKVDIHFTDEKEVKYLESKYKVMLQTVETKLKYNHNFEIIEHLCTQVAFDLAYLELLNVIHYVIFSDDQNDSKIEILKTMIQWDEIFKKTDI